MNLSGLGCSDISCIVGSVLIVEFVSLRIFLGATGDFGVIGKWSYDSGS